MKIKNWRIFNATIIQHEINHLDGIIFVDNMVKEKASKKDTRKEKKGGKIMFYYII